MLETMHACIPRQEIGLIMCARGGPGGAGLRRCGKSCRLRWLNYLRPNIKRGNISYDEEDLIIRLHKLLGNRSVSVV